MLSTIKRLRTLKRGFHALHWNQLVTKKKWLFIEKTVVEPTIIGYVHVAVYGLHSSSNMVVTIYNDQGYRLGEIYVTSRDQVSVSIDVSGDLKRVSESEERIFKSFVEGKVWKADFMKSVPGLPSHK